METLKSYCNSLHNIINQTDIMISKNMSQLSQIEKNCEKGYIPHRKAWKRITQIKRRIEILLKAKTVYSDMLIEVNPTYVQ